jgi:hypothetical protein
MTTSAITGATDETINNVISYLEVKEWKRKNLEGQPHKANSWQFRVDQMFVQGHHTTALNSHLALRR